MDFSGGISLLTVTCEIELWIIEILKTMAYLPLSLHFLATVNVFSMT